MFSAWTSLLGPRLLSPTAHCPLSVPTGMLYDISSATWSKTNSEQGSLIIPSVLSPKPPSYPDSSFSHILHAIHSELLLVPPSTCNQTLTTSTTSTATTLVQATVTACLLADLPAFCPSSLHCILCTAHRGSCKKARHLTNLMSYCSTLFTLLPSQGLCTAWSLFLESSPPKYLLHGILPHLWWGLP